jgi:hypothetical protein
VADSRDHGSEPSGSIKGRYLSDGWLLTTLFHLVS